MNRANMRGRSIRRWPTELNAKMLWVAFRIMTNLSWRALWRIENYRPGVVRVVKSKIVPGRVKC